jgi:molybdopterin-guanine dinucleotide biosynthesis protein A
LIAFAGERDALCLACDMPYVSAALLSRLSVESGHGMHVLAPRDAATGKWQPFFARYHSASVAPWLASALAQGERSFQGLFRHLTIRELSLDEPERAQLRDWDTPEDMRA